MVAKSHGAVATRAYATEMRSSEDTVDCDAVDSDTIAAVVTGTAAPTVFRTNACRLPDN
jgi:hypothetical protein